MIQTSKTQQLKTKGQGGEVQVAGNQAQPVSTFAPGEFDLSSLARVARSAATDGRVGLSRIRVEGVGRAVSLSRLVELVFFREALWAGSHRGEGACRWQVDCRKRVSAERPCRARCHWPLPGLAASFLPGVRRPAYWSPVKRCSPGWDESLWVEPLLCGAPTPS